jgi:hypothetical protein
MLVKPCFFKMPISSQNIDHSSRCAMNRMEQEFDRRNVDD